MNNMVKNVFLTIMGVVAAMIVYVLLFGAVDLRGNSVDLSESSGLEGKLLGWKGALWYAAESMETPVSMYYYNYCYVPNVHISDYVDEALGGTAQWGSSYRETPADLSSSSVDTYKFNFSENSGYWSTGWR